MAIAVVEVLQGWQENVMTQRYNIIIITNVVEGMRVCPVEVYSQEGLTAN